MPRRRAAFIAVAACATLFVLVMGWDVLVEQPRLGGDQICFHDAEAAQLIGASQPGVYMFDRQTGRPRRIPASMAFAMVFQGISSPHYPGEAGCGARALTQTADGWIALGSLLGAIVGLPIAVFTRGGS